jgi:hypothetical protein
VTSSPFFGFFFIRALFSFFLALYKTDNWIKKEGSFWNFVVQMDRKPKIKELLKLSLIANVKDENS